MVAVPELQIVEDALWQAAKARQKSLDAQMPEGMNYASPAQPAPFWSKQRPRYLFSGLMQCGVCGGGFSKISQQHFGCSSARNKGETVCTNRTGIRRDVLEDTVLDGLRHWLMDPGLFKIFAAAFTAEWNRQQAHAGADIAAQQAEHVRVVAQIERLVDALMNGTPAAAVNDRLKGLESRRLALEQELAGAVAPAPRLHPNLAEVYRKNVAELVDALAHDDTSQARELVRGLVEAIVLVPEGGRLRVEVRGALAAILTLSVAPNAKSPVVYAEALSLQAKLVAGMRNHRKFSEIRAFC